MTTRLNRWDAADFLQTPQDRAAYIDAVLEMDDPALLSQALGDVARAYGMSNLARETGLSRENLYRALTEEGNPRLSTVCSVLDCLGLSLAVTVK